MTQRAVFVECQTYLSPELQQQQQRQSLHHQQQQQQQQLWPRLFAPEKFILNLKQIVQRSFFYVVIVVVAAAADFTVVVAPKKACPQEYIFPLTRSDIAIAPKQPKVSSSTVKFN